MVPMLRSRWLRRALLPAVLTTAACLSALAGADPDGAQPVPTAAAPTIHADLHLRQAGYRLDAESRTGRVAVRAADGSVLTVLPLTAVAGGDRLPPDAVTHVVAASGGLVATTSSRDGTVWSTASVVATRSGFTVAFRLRPPAHEAHHALFFSDGTQGLDLSQVTAYQTPDPAQRNRLVAVDTATRTPLAPAPLEVALGTGAGWMGIGLVDVPDATRLELTPAGAVSIDYPLSQLATFDDTGAGGRCEQMLCFPRFVITTTTDPASVVGAYRAALVDLGAAPAQAAAEPAAWWQQPIVDTWGEQVAEHVIRGSSGYTAAWVRRFVASWKSRFGVPGATIVIDSRWQRSIGDPVPDPRFGGVVGMRALIDGLHAQGYHVLLWWPLWSHGLPSVPPSRREVQHASAGQIVDPTTPAFDGQMTDTVVRLLGQGPDDLNADGLKLDWQYDIPTQLAHPAAGWGDAALLHYLSVIHTAAHAVRADALVDSSAAAPQFAATTDAVRIYDAWSEAEWDARARVVDAALPGTLIDGDGWQATPEDVLAHAVASTVYGVPAVYFTSRWADGRPLAAATARILGAIVSLSGLKGPGHAVLQAGGWRYVDAGLVRAEQVDGGRGILVWTGPPAHLVGHLVTIGGGGCVLPVSARQHWRIVDGNGNTLSWHAVGGHVALQTSQAVAVTLSLS